MATFRITLVKATPYKAEAEELWSNSYYLSGTEPGDAADWVSLAEAIWGIEGAFIYSDPALTHLVHGYGYAPGSDVAAWSGDFTAGGTGPGIAPVGGGFTTAGFDHQTLPVCALIRMQCGLSSHTGKPRYIMKYIHDVPYYENQPDTVQSLSVAGIAALALYHSGDLPGSSQVCAPDGTLATNAIMHPYWTTHQIKRRGKRPRRGA